MKELSVQVIADLMNRTRSIVEFTENELLNTPQYVLTKRITPGKWNVLECLHHLNLYADFYLPVFLREINNSRNNGFKSSDFFSAGLMGKYFYESVKVKEGPIKPVKTFKDKDPMGMSLPENVTEEFLSDQKEYLVVLKQAQLVDLEKTRVPVTFSKLLKLQLGDALRFNVYHNERHIVQVKDLLEKVKLEMAKSMS